MPDSLISVIIVNLNGERFLPDCLRSLSLQTFRDFEVIVVDNGSTDNSLDLIKRHFKWVKVIPLEKNEGFAKGNNVGFEASSSKYAATLNNDTIADGSWLGALFEAAEADGSIGMVASKIYLGKEGNVLDSAGMLLYPDGMTRQRGRGETDRGQFDSIGEVLFPSACAALYRRDMLKETGYFDESFFSYCEDADMGLRARLEGWKAVLAPAAVVRHLYSQTGGKYSVFKAYHVERNHVWVLLKNMPVSYIVFSPIFTCWRYIVQLYALLSGKGSVARLAESGGRLHMIGIVIRAYCGAFAGIAGVLKKRRAAWSSRRLSVGRYKELLKSHRITARELILRD